jgi:hypothetical protein
MRLLGARFADDQRVGTFGVADQVADGTQRSGSSSATRLAGCVGIRAAAS